MRIAFLTLGCKVNFYETENMKKQFEEAGHQIVSFEEEAEVYVVNTCTVTNIADRKSRKMLHRAKRKSPNALIVAAGCYVDSASKNGEYDESIDVFIPNEKKKELLDVILEAYREKIRSLEHHKVEELVPGRGEYSAAAWEERHTRAYLNIQNGCNQYCTYCIIPYVRGPLVSRPEKEVLQEVEKLAEQGVLEVVLTGIHLSSYGVDLLGCKNFLELEGRPLLELIQKISEVAGIQRIRLSSLEPRIITEYFVQQLSKIKKVCPHFHLSLQSGCDSVLKRMNRHYTAEEYFQKVGLLREMFAQPAITTDVIVGFPGETWEEFEETYRFMQRVEFSKVHIFKYSRRRGTMADTMPNQISEQEKGRRSEWLLEKEVELEQGYRKKFYHQVQEVLFEEILSFDGEDYLVGYNERYLRIGVKVKEQENARELVNTIQPMRILGQVNMEGENLLVSDFLEIPESIKIK